MRNIMESEIPCIVPVKSDITGETFFYCVENEFYMSGVNYCRHSDCEFFADFDRRAYNAWVWSEEGTHNV